MGVQLNQAGQAIGQAAGSPYYSVPGAVSGSYGFGTLATGTDAIGKVFEGIGGAQQAGYASRIQSLDARAALAGGQIEEEKSKEQYGSLESRQKVTAASRGVGVNSGTEVAQRQTTEDLSAINAALIHYNAAREAYGFSTQAGLEKQAGQNILGRGLLSAGGSLLSGATGLSDKWLQFSLAKGLDKMPGADTGSGFSVPGN